MGDDRRSSAATILKDRFRYFRKPSSIFSSPDSGDDARGPLGLQLLHEPSEPRCDFVFVHGLGGGSRKTWSASEQFDTFWPQQWLPYERGFKHVRIHSFGYDSDWTKSQKSSLTIHDYAQALLSELYNSPHLKTNAETQIVLIAHSMGGLVVKKSINEEFRHVCHDIGLWSFFEGSATTVGPTSMMIVDKDSGTMGMPHENMRYLPADHRHICKFNNTFDPCYITLVRCFGTTVEEIMKDFTSKRKDDHKSQMKSLSVALKGAQRPEAALIAVSDKRYEGSCQWILDDTTFREWISTDINDTEKGLLEKPVSPCRVLWINGPPGSGKSVAAGHIIRHLEALNQDCAYYFFSTSTKTSLTHLLFSIGLQMAETNSDVREMFLSLISDGEMVNSEDHNVIWNSLFLGKLLKVAFRQPQYWVIDALDECPSRALPILIQMLARIDSGDLLRIVITSRPNSSVKRLFTQEKVRKFEIRTGQQDSLKDIAAYVRSRLSSPDDGSLVEDSEDNDMIPEILEKSNGIFLWASLITTRLGDVYSVEQKREVLRQVPSEMNGMYWEILRDIRESSSSDLAHCILKWVLCAPQPLTTEEVRAAVWYDIRQTLRSAEHFSQICGNLITVDQESRVQFMHQTAREFLTGPGSGNYIDRGHSHERIAEVCLNRLNEKAFEPPRTRTLTASSSDAELTPIDEYACAHFSYHLAHCLRRPQDGLSDHPDLLNLLLRFSSSHILAWVERTATLGRLAPFTRTISNLRSYFARHLQTHSPLDANFQHVQSMVEDLARLLAIFGQNLLDMPSSIYSLIPILCPTSSIIHSSFGRDQRQKLICSFNLTWDERLSCFPYPCRVYSIASNDQYLAVGLHNGSVQLYRGSTLEFAASLEHGEPVRRLAFGTISNTLAVCGPQNLSVWVLQPTPSLQWRMRVSPLPLSVSFSADDSKVMVPVKSGIVLSFSASDGGEHRSIPLFDDGSESDSDESDRQIQGVTATVVRLSPELGLVAAAFRNSHMVIRTMDGDEKVGTIKKDGYEDIDNPIQILDIVFNQIPDLSLLAACYLDGEIVTYDPWQCRKKNSVNVYCNILASSPDGRTLAAGDHEGAIYIFGFDTLRLMYHISALEERVMGIVFASNSLRLFDIRGSSANTWEPWVLIRKNMADDSSSESDDNTMTVPEARYTRSFELGRAIVAVAQAGSDHLICGREDGSISIHGLESFSKPQELRYHARHVPIQNVEWHAKSRTLFSVDMSGRCIAARLSASWELERTIFDHRAASTVRQALLKADGSAYLVSTQEGEELWELGQDQFTISAKSNASSCWVIHPTDSTRLLLFSLNTVHLFKWKNLTNETSEAGILLVPREGSPGFPEPKEWLHRSGVGHLFQVRRASTPKGIFLLDLSQISPSSTEVPVVFISKDSLPIIRDVLGIHRSDLYFLSRQGWVCSMSVKTILNPNHYKRHFFVPPLWQIGRETIACIISSRKSVAFAYRDELVVFQGFLEFSQKVDLVDESMARSTAMMRGVERRNSWAP